MTSQALESIIQKIIEWFQRVILAVQQWLGIKKKAKGEKHYTDDKRSLTGKKHVSFGEGPAMLQKTPRRRIAPKSILRVRP